MHMNTSRNEAERQRNDIVRMLNEEMMLNGSGGTSRYLAPAEFWETVPEFQYRQPSIGSTWRQSFPDFFILLFWGWVCLVALFLLGRTRAEF